jgi:hypothetical protein
MSDAIFQQTMALALDVEIIKGAVLADLALPHSIIVLFKGLLTMIGGKHNLKPIMIYHSSLCCSHTEHGLSFHHLVTNILIQRLNSGLPITKLPTRETWIARPCAN